MNRTIAIAAGVGIFISWLVHRTLRKRTTKSSNCADATKWQHIGQLQEITFYPVKSAAAAELDEAVCDERGLSSSNLRDRHFVLLTEDQKIANGSTHPKFLCIETEIVGDNVICVGAPNAKPLTLNIAELIKDGEVVEKQKRGFRMRLVECKAEHHKWFSQVILERDVALRLFVALEPIVETSWWRNSTAEIFPIMVMHRKSVEDLNTRLLPKDQVHHWQFRGNLFIDSLPYVKAYDEDRWLWLKIGDDEKRCVIMRYNSDCLRCILVNIDVKTCERSADFEPLRTLKKYRCRVHAKEPSMGRYYDILKIGMLKAGDSVYVQYE